MTGEHIRLLLVEDSEDDAELICLELTNSGFVLDRLRVDTEQDFRAALEREWDMIISDYHMPTFDGMRAFQIYKELGIDTPFIFVSGALGEERAVEAMRFGARDYLLKGHLRLLGSAVRRELEQAKVRREARRAEEQSLRERSRLAMAVEASGAGVFEHSVPPGHDTYCSERFAELLGYAVEDIPATEQFVEWMFEQVHWDDVRELRRSYQELIEGRAQRCAAEVRLRHDEGHWVDVALFAKLVRHDMHGGEAAHVVGVVLDLTERRRLENQFRQAQKMEAVGRLAGGVAHDFNNILTAIFSFSHFVLEELDVNHAAWADMQEVVKAAERAEGLTRQLLAFSRRRAVHPLVLNINEQVESIDKMLRRILGEDIDVDIQLQSDLWNVKIDPNALQQAIVNLAVNARDAMPSGGRLTIETRNQSLDTSLLFGRGEAIPPGEYVMLSISDSGVGMDEQTSQSIFEPFFTTKPSGQGTGLGLSTCYGIIKQANGFIWFKSEVNKGSTFYVCLPRSASDTESPSVSKPTAQLMGTETVLFVEDNDQVRSLGTRALQRLGYRVLVATDGQEALTMAADPNLHIDLLVTDVIMPHVGGKQLVQMLLRSRPGLKVLYMSGYTPDAIMHHGIFDQASVLMQKPFTPDSLAEKVRKVLDADSAR